MSNLKTTANDNDVNDFIDGVDDKVKKNDSIALLKMYSKLTGAKPKMWGPSIIGFGQYYYKSDRSTQEGDWPLTGFSPRKQNLTLYFNLGFDDYSELLADLGKYKTSKGCLYINKLADVDMNALEILVARSFDDMRKMHPLSN